MTGRAPGGHIDFVDQTLRDGQQSLWGMQMRAYEAAEALPHLDRTGFKVIDLTGAGMFTVLLRRFADDPWATTDFLVKHLPSNTIRSGLRTISVIGFAHTPEVIIDLWVRTMIKHGVPSFWLYDCLFDLPTMKRLVDVVRNEGGIPVPAVMYGYTDVHDDAFFASRAATMADWEGVESIYVEDAAGVLKPERAATLLPAIRAATGEIPLELHCHNTTGLAQHNYIEGLRAGFTMFHTCSQPMANGPSLPSTEAMLPILAEQGFTHRLDTDAMPPVVASFLARAAEAGYETGAMAEYDPRIYAHQLPGGMTGTLKAQLAQHGMAHRLPEVLALIPQVREDLGQPIMATPFSQFVGTQAVLNLVTGEEYSLVPDEVIHYVLGHYGPLPKDVAPQVKDRILTSPRAAEIAAWVRPDPTLAEIRSRFPAGCSDEELLLRFMCSDEEVDAMLAKGPIRTDPRRCANHIVRNISDLIADKRAVTSLAVTTPQFSLSLTKHGVGTESERRQERRL